ncbi:MAG: DUF5132 domain-containing protein [Gammaproteobacteria bacterium]|nr:DUF5132 domain-containing protein [Gammaproteobacteria bacterium]
MLMLPVWLGYAGASLAGAACAKVIGTVVKSGAGALRPVAKTMIKGGALMGEQVKAIAAGVKEDFEDVTAEAFAEIEARKTDDTAGPGEATNGKSPSTGKSTRQSVSGSAKSG